MFLKNLLSRSESLSFNLHKGLTLFFIKSGKKYLANKMHLQDSNKIRI